MLEMILFYCDEVKSFSRIDIKKDELQHTKTTMEKLSCLKN